MLSNLYLHPLDEALDAEGYELVRYADDLVILCRDEQQARRALERLQELTGSRSLRLHPEKTRIVDATVPGKGFDFLGYHFEAGHRWPRKKSMDRFKDNIRQQTPRRSGRSLDETIGSLNRTLSGWFAYFKHSRRRTFRALDRWVRRRLRTMLRYRIKLKGMSRGEDHRRWPIAFFRVQGLFCLEEAHRAAVLQSSRG